MRLPGPLLMVAQACALVSTFWSAAWSAFFYLPIAVATAALRTVLPGCDGRCDGWARFYEVRKYGAGQQGWPEGVLPLPPPPAPRSRPPPRPALRTRRAAASMGCRAP